MAEKISITCCKCAHEFKIDEKKLKTKTIYPEMNPRVIYNFISLRPTVYLVAICPKCSTENHIGKV